MTAPAPPRSSKRWPTRRGVSYLRTTRGSYPGLYPAGGTFPVGGAKVLSAGDDVTLVGAGVTLHACLGAAEILRAQGIDARVIDCYSVKPIDTVTLTAAVDTTCGRIVIADDHHPEGGLGSAVTDALLAAGRTNLSVTHLAVRGLPGSGSGAKLLAFAGLDADHSPRPPAGSSTSVGGARDERSHDPGHGSGASRCRYA